MAGSVVFIYETPAQLINVKMTTVRLNIAYKSILVATCLLASLSASRCEAETYMASGEDTQSTQECQREQAAPVLRRS